MFDTEFERNMAEQFISKEEINFEVGDGIKFAPDSAMAYEFSIEPAQVITGDTIELTYQGVINGAHIFSFGYFQFSLDSKMPVEYNQGDKVKFKFSVTK